MKCNVTNSKGTIAILLLVTLILFYEEVPAQQSLASSLGMIAYPQKGQSAQQQNSDEGQCYSWAKEYTGIDPFTTASQPTTQGGPAVGGGERVAGAARGALGGLAIGAIVGDAGKGAGIGAISGTLLGGRRARQNQASQANQAQQNKNSALQHFNKAFGACIEGRGYIVK